MNAGWNYSYYITWSFLPKSINHIGGKLLLPKSKNEVC